MSCILFSTVPYGDQVHRRNNIFVLDQFQIVVTVKKFETQSFKMLILLRPTLLSSSGLSVAPWFTAAAVVTARQWLASTDSVAPDDTM